MGGWHSQKVLERKDEKSDSCQVFPDYCQLVPDRTPGLDELPGETVLIAERFADGRVTLTVPRAGYKVGAVVVVEHYVLRIGPHGPCAQSLELLGVRGDQVDCPFAQFAKNE